jgi:hypothetical protein
MIAENRNSDRLTGLIVHLRPHGERRLPAESTAGSMSGSQISVCSLNNAASINTVD